jgi:drug/metabolite transporter (DMT)-like permease
MSSSTQGSTPDEETEGVHKAGAFDMRNFIAALIGIYGVVLVVYGIIGSSAAQLKKADNVNINLWAGIGMVVVAAVFFTWARLRPVVVPDHVGDDQERPPGGH